MALTHQRAIHVRLEDYGSGQGNTRDVTVTQVALATQRPTIVSLGFAGTGSAVALGGPATGITGQARSIVSRTRTCYLSLNAQLNGQPIQIPVPPNAQVFIPNTIDCSSATVTPNTSFPLPAGYPVASSTAQLAYDLVVEA